MQPLVELVEPALLCQHEPRGNAQLCCNLGVNDDLTYAAFDATPLSFGRTRRRRSRR